MENHRPPSNEEFKALMKKLWMEAERDARIEKEKKYREEARGYSSIRKK